MNEFDAAVRQDGAMAIVDLAGTIDGGAEAALDAAYAGAAELRAGTVALDFTRVEYINSTGIALLVSLLAKARRDGRPVLAWGLTDHYREIFEITRLADFLEVVADEQTARSAAGSSTNEG
ncbi:MAG: STAS domain-containing protein [Acidimicrobiales bacterium]